MKALKPYIHMQCECLYTLKKSNLKVAS